MRKQSKGQQTQTLERYYFSPDRRTYIKREGSEFYVLKKGELVNNRYYDGIVRGSLYAWEITKEEFERAQQKQRQAS